MNITLFEVHFPNAEFNAPFTGSPGAPLEESDLLPDLDGSSSPLGPVVALVALTGFALLFRYLRGGEAEQTTLDEVEV